MPYDYNLLKVRINKKIAFVTVDNPPMNLMTGRMMWELLSLSEEIAADDRVRVIIFDSADPDYFIAHFDVDGLLQYPDEPSPKLGRLKKLVQVSFSIPRLPTCLLEPFHALFGLRHNHKLIEKI